MNSFDTKDFHKHQLIQIDDYPLTFKPTLEIISDRNSTSNYISTLSMNQSSILFPNKSTNNKNHSRFLYSNNITEISDISKKDLEYDIQLTALKKKLLSSKEQRKQSEIKVNLMKLRINKLQNEEKASLRELKNIKLSIQKIKINRAKAKKNDINKTFNQNKRRNNFIKNKTLSFINDNNSVSFYNNSNFKENHIKIRPHNIFNISLERNNLNKNFQKNFTPKTKFLSSQRGLTISNSRNNISNDNFGAYSFRNESINLDKLSLNKNTSKSKVNKNRVIPNTIPYNKSKNSKHQKDLKSQVKKNLENKLKSDEEERKKIQEEIRQIEKQQYDLWMNFNENMNNENYNSNINNNYKKKIKNNLFFKDEEDNIVNYNFI